MRRRNVNLLVIAVIVLIAAAVARRLLGDQSAATAGNGGGAIDVTVHEGTSMAIALSPDKTRIVIDLQGGLWVLPIGGGKATRITDEYGDARQPSWSPDGKTIAFQSYRDGMWRIWTVGVDGSNLASVTSGSFDDREPQWSPDGSTIAFSSDRSGNYDVWLLNLATRDVRQLTTDPANDYFPAWSPDGHQIAFVSTRTASPGVYAISLDGSERLLAASSGTLGAPSWSPEGKVLFSALPAANAVAPDNQSKLVLDGQTIATGEDYFPFHAQWISANELIYPADGQIKRRSLGVAETKPIAFEATLTLAPATYTRKRRDLDSTAENRVLGVMRPVIAPDGKQMAFGALGDLWITPIGGTPTRLTDDRFVDTDAAWSPDGTKIAFSSDRAGGMDIWVRDLRTNADRRLTSLPDAEMAATWSPDGKWIAFVSNQAYEQGELYVVAADGGEPRKIHDRIFGVGYPSWTRDGRRVITSALQPYSSRYRESMNHYWAVPVDGDSPEGPERSRRAEMIAPQAHQPVGKRAADGPAISPDGRLMAFVSHDYLYVMPIGPDAQPTGPPRQITSELTDSISWAGPDRILYIATDRLKLVSVSDGATSDVPLNLTWTRKMPAERTVVHAGRLIDGVQSTARLDVDLVIEKNRIVAIEPHSDRLHAGRVIDAADQSVMPGLIEGHGHNLKEHGDLFGRVHLAYGVTGFRNVGGMPYDALEDKEAIESGRRVGPRVFTTGYLLDGARPYYPMASTAPTEAVVDMELARAKALDYDMFKTYVRLPDLLQKRAIEGAHRIGIPTSSHEIYPAALVGGDSVEHTGATSRRGYSTKQSGMGRAYQDVIAIIAKSGMTITPTLGLGGFQAAVRADPSILDDPRWMQLQPSWTRATLAAAARAGRGAPRTGPTEGQKTVLAMHKAGVRIIAGVDSPLTPYATALHFELQDYVAAGLTPFEALKTATINIATLMGAAADLGTLEVGKLADMVLVDGNPLTNIADTLRVRTVIKNGEIFAIEDLMRVPTMQ
jgi:Tol biopolymer transport system component/imidazolonepropionase-like amidohydrolase